MTGENLPNQTSPDQTSPDQTPIDAEALLTAMRRKQGTWVEWAEACQTLQKAGQTDQAIFEATGFEPIQQNQIIVAMQVYKSIVQVGINDATKTHFGQRASDVLYEFRILAPSDRAAAAEFACDRKIDMDEAREIAKAMKDFTRLSQPPAEFTSHPGDIMAYFAWRAAKQKTDLQARSLLIAKGLKYAHSATARRQVEGLLTDFSASPAKAAPRMPVYRLETDEELPSVLPVVGEMPLTLADLQAVPLYETEEPFGIVKFSGTGAYVPVPGWQVIRTASDPLVLLAMSDQLPTRLPGNVEQVLVVVDRAQRSWDADSYFVVANEANELEIQWFEEAPAGSLLGRVILVMRPKKILDESYTQELWQFEE
ncbi:MAG: hypothetical protein B0A82_25535 [Alkalinema sp. CACIAM 70d]|nr:MAG: hypothetical protein B0A82_25535 [Alkalinema sp. CACIAM 70d]